MFGGMANSLFGGGDKEEDTREIELDDELAAEFDDIDKQARQAQHRRHAEDEPDEEELAAGNADLEAPPEDGEILERGFMSVKPWLGAMAKPTGFEFGKTDEKPKVKLELEHVYGYRGNRCRNNILWVDSKTILYFAAAVGIVHDIEANTQKFFRMHSDDVISVDYHREKRLVVTGEQGKTPAIYVWDVDTCEMKSKMAGFHKRAITSVCFSKDGDLVASVGQDDKHSVAVYDWETGALKGGKDADTNKVLHIVANPNENNEFVSVGVKHIKFWDLSGGLTVKAGILGKLGSKQPFMSAAFVQNHAIVGTQSGEIYVFAGNQLCKVLPAHDRTIFAMRAYGDVVMTGGRDGFVSLWDPNTFKKIHTYNFNEHEDKTAMKNGSQPNNIRAVDMMDGVLVVGTVTNSIYTTKVEGGDTKRVLASHYGDLDAAQNYGELWGLATSTSADGIFASASDDSTLRLWDMNKREEIKRINLPGPAKCCAWSPDSQTVAIGQNDGTVVVVDREGTQKAKIVTKTKKRVQCIRFSPSGNLLATGTADMCVDVYDVQNKYKLKGHLKGNSSTILHIDFSEDETFIQSCSQAYELLFYNTTSMAQHTASRGLKDTKWDTFTSILGWDVQGIWPKESDGSDINSVSRSHNRKLLASAEDTGLVKLFQYPCVGSGLDKKGVLKRRPHSERGHGHSSHVTEVQWAPGDDRLFSAGGGDLSIFQWKVVPEE